MRIRVGLPALLWMSLVLAVTAASAGAQRSAVTLAYQLTHVDMGEPFPSSDGKKLVFEITLGGFQQLFIMNPEGSGQTQITHDAANHDTPSWSPDGHKIAYVSDKTGHAVIYMMNPDGTGEERLTDNQHEYIHPNWSPNGAKVIYCSDDDLFTMNADGTGVQLLANTEGRATEPRWSPDGKTIYFTNCKKVDWAVDCHAYAATVPPGVPVHP